MLDKLMFSLEVTVICMAIVFLVLIALSLIISFQRIIVEAIEGTRGKKEDKSAAKKASEPQGYSVEISEMTDDEELIAVISAAVAAVLGRPTSKIVVRSIRKIEPAAPAWSIAGRQDQINTRF